MEIELNGKKLIKGKKQSDKYCGYYKVLKKGIEIYDNNDTKVGFINLYGVLGSATLFDFGWWYSYGTPKVIGDYNSHSKEMEETTRALEINGLKRICSRW